MNALGLVGCGLLGSSFALAARRFGCFDVVLGYDSSREVNLQAMELGVIDGIWNRKIRVDAICIAVPTQAIGAVLREMLDIVQDDVPIFDVGSVKASITVNGESPPSNFIPCHPIAGSHLSGPEAAREDLFKGNVCVVTPTHTSNPTMVDAVVGWWEKVGAQVVQMSAEAHDKSVALTSHLPHLLSYAIVDMLRNACDDTKTLVGSGFLDFSRLAGGDATMWRSIFVDNQDNLRIGFRELAECLTLMLNDAEQNPDDLERKLRAIAVIRGTLDDK